jgi:hypothetical protein
MHLLGERFVLFCGDWGFLKDGVSKTYKIVQITHQLSFCFHSIYGLWLYPTGKWPSTRTPTSATISRLWSRGRTVKGTGKPLIVWLLWLLCTGSLNCWGFSKSRAGHILRYYLEPIQPRRMETSSNFFSKQATLLNSSSASFSRGSEGLILCLSAAPRGLCWQRQANQQNKQKVYTVLFFMKVLLCPSRAGFSGTVNFSPNNGNCSVYFLCHWVFMVRGCTQGQLIALACSQDHGLWM